MFSSVIVFIMMRFEVLVRLVAFPIHVLTTVYMFLFFSFEIV